MTCLARHFLILVACTWALALSACGRAASEDAPAAPAGPSYAAVAAGKVDIEGGLVDIASRQAGIVREVLVREGDEVRTHQVLAQLDDQDARLARARSIALLHQAEADVAAFEANLAGAQRDQARTVRLAEANFVSPQRVESAADAVRTAQSQYEVRLAAVEVARASLAEANQVVEQHIVRAPSEGRIVRRYANPGSGASTFQVTPMFQLQPQAPRIVRAEVDEQSLTAIRIGMPVEITPEADPSQTYEGVVLRIAEVFGARRLQSDDASQQTDQRVVEVVVDAGESPLLVGQRVLVKFLDEQSPRGLGPAAEGE